MNFHNYTKKGNNENRRLEGKMRAARGMFSRLAAEIINSTLICLCDSNFLPEEQTELTNNKTILYLGGLVIGYQLSVVSREEWKRRR